MAIEQPVERMPEILRKQLAHAVKNIQWSYAIFWSISSSQPGVLEWEDGYYNGDIKTRKTVQSVQLTADQLGLQRTEQLRELYESLLDAESNPQSARPSAALSPEDLTDTEWLPGRSYAKKQSTWLCNAHSADSKVFSRSLLAKSASIQTVVCFPYLGGVIELGTTELVSEDPNIIQHITTSILESPGIVVSNNSEHVIETARIGSNTNHVQLNEKVAEANLNPDTEWEKANTCSQNSSSEEFEPSDRGIELNEGASQVQSWKLMNEDISNSVLNSGDSSNCISQTFVSLDKIAALHDKDKVNEDHLLDLEDCKDMELTSVELQNDDIHYQGIVSTLLKTSHQLIMGPCFESSIKDSCFVRWKKGRLFGNRKSTGGTSQRLLKKVLYDVAQMHGDLLHKTRENNGKGGTLKKPEADDRDANHVLADTKQIEKMQEKFAVLGSIVSSSGKVDNVSVLDGTIEYLRDLEKRVEELESLKELQDTETRRRKRSCDVVESTSDNYGDKRIHNCKKRVLNKRKASCFCETRALNQSQQEDNLTDDVIVTKTGKNVLIEVNCPWRNDLFVEIMGATSNLHLDCQSVQSSNIDGHLSLTIKSKVKGSTMSSVKTIRQALQRVTGKS